MTIFKTFTGSSLEVFDLKQKRELLKEVKEAIKFEVSMQKNIKATIKQSKENERKAKVLESIKAAEDKLAKLKAKLS